MDNSQSYYDVLNISPQASDEDVKRAYKELAKIYHPDLNPQNRRLAALRFKAITEAYSHLNTRVKRAEYNRQLRMIAENDNRTGTSFFEQIGEILWPANKSDAQGEKQ